MKIKMWKLYLDAIIYFSVLGICMIIGAVVYTAVYYTGGGADDFFMLFICVPMGILVALFPFVLNYRNMTGIQIADGRCTSYSLFGKKICEVDLNKKIYRTDFYVRFKYKPERKFVAVSNEPFICERRQKSIFEKKFYATYDRKKVIVFPYDKKASSLLRSGDSQNKR